MEQGLAHPSLWMSVFQVVLEMNNPNHVSIDDVGELVALLGETADVRPKHLPRLLLAALKIPRVDGSGVHPLEVADEDPAEVRPVVDAVRLEIL